MIITMKNNGLRWLSTQPLYWILGVTAIVRVMTACISIGYMDPNEVYRTLEPIAAQEGFATRPAWEWTQHLLFKFPVVVHTWVVEAADAVGIHGSIEHATLLRCLYALLSLFTVALAWRLSEGVSLRWRVTTALSLGLWPEFVFRSVRLMDYSLEASGLAAALLLILPSKNTPISRPTKTFLSKHLFFGGVLLGTLFFIRPQSGLHLVAVLAGFAVDAVWSSARQDPFLKRVLPVICGYAAAIVVGGVFEMSVAGGEFLGPFFKYWEYNFVQSGATKNYGIDPWHRYFSETAKMLGAGTLLAALVILMMPPCYFRKLRTTSSNREASHVVKWIVGISFTALSIVGHKEDRFIAGFIWLLLPLVAVTFAGAEGLKKRTRAAIIVCLGILAIPPQLHRTLARLTLHADAVEAFAEIEKQIDGKSKRLPLVVHGDPDFLPGGFYLRHHGPLCYVSANTNPGDCSRAQTSPRIELRLRELHGHSKWKLVRH